MSSTTRSLVAWRNWAKGSRRWRRGRIHAGVDCEDDAAGEEEWVVTVPAFGRQVGHGSICAAQAREHGYMLSGVNVYVSYPI